MGGVDRRESSTTNNSGVNTVNSTADDLRVRKDEDGFNLESAVQLLLHAAELGFVAAKTDLGILFELGTDYENALKW
jgi:hypothetical protein